MSANRENAAIESLTLPRNNDIDIGGSIDRQQLSDVVTQAAKISRKASQLSSQSSSLTQLNLANMHLHGRDEDMNLLKRKLHEFAKVDDADAARRLELLLVAGVSG